MLTFNLYLRSSKAAHSVMGYVPTRTEIPPESVFRFEFLKPEELKSHTFDVVIVGSGAGGGVAAKELAEAGLRVLVIERGKHVEHEDEPLTEGEAMELMYDKACFLQTLNGGCALIEGSVFGGGTTVNWAACLQVCLLLDIF